MSRRSPNHQAKKQEEWTAERERKSSGGGEDNKGDKGRDALVEDAGTSV